MGGNTGCGPATGLGRIGTGLWGDDALVFILGVLSGLSGGESVGRALCEIACKSGVLEQMDRADDTEEPRRLRLVPKESW